MPDADYWLGAAALLGTLGSAAVSASFLVSRRAASLQGVPRFLAWSLAATVVLVMSCVIPGALGVFGRWTLLATAALLMSATRLLAASVQPRAVSFPPTLRTASKKEWALATFGTGAVVAWVALAAIQQRFQPPIGFDAATAYLPTAATWVQSGSIWSIQDWLPGFAYGAAPGNGTTILAALIVPFRTDFLAHFATYPFVGLMGLAIYGIGREVRATAPLSALVASAIVAAPVVIRPPLQTALFDPVLYFSFATGLLFLLRHSRTRARSDLVIAAAGLGLAFGTKFYGFSVVPTTILVWGVGELLRRTPLAEMLRGLSILVGGCLALGGFWILRNWVETGNPAFPVEISLLGTTVFNGPPDPFVGELGRSLASYIGDLSIWPDHFAHQFRLAAGLPLAVLAGSTLAAAALLARARIRSEHRSDMVAAGLCVLAFALAVGYAITPQTGGQPDNPIIASLNFRYGIPALIAAGGVTAWLGGRVRAPFAILMQLALVVGIVDLLWIDGLLSHPKTAVALGVAAALTLAIFLIDLPGMNERMPRRSIPLAGALAALAVAIVGVGIAQRHYEDGRYRGLDPALDWVEANTVGGAKVGIAGAWNDQGVAPVYPAFGDDLRNRVSYLGRSPDHFLTRIDSRDEFATALARVDPAVVILGRAGTSRPASGAEGREPIEAPWIRAAKFCESARSDRFVVFAAPARCP